MLFVTKNDPAIPSNVFTVIIIVNIVSEDVNYVTNLGDFGIRDDLCDISFGKIAVYF
jgi:hypothetical protein